jgi:hypothetical protein
MNRTKVNPNSVSDSQLNEVIGVALRGLVEGGCAPAFLATFAERYRPEFARALDLTAMPPPDPRALNDSAVSQVLAAPWPQPQRQKVRRLNVTAHGVRRMVSVHSDKLQVIVGIAGGARQAHHLVQEYASAAPAGAPLSPWVNAQLDALIRLRDADPERTQRH